MSQLTITEALAEIKTLEKRIEKKSGSLQPYIGRQEGVKDPLEKSGGSAAFIAAERQSIGDLQKNIVNLRIGINRANDNTTITIEGVTRTISEWLIWRRDISKNEQKLLQVLRSSIESIRQGAKRQGLNLVSKETEALQPSDWISILTKRL